MNSHLPRRLVAALVLVVPVMVAVLAGLLIPPAANAQLAICSRVTPPPSYCTEGEPPEEPVPPAPAPAPAPSDFVMAANTPSSITLSWTDNAINETGFTIDKVVDGYWKPIAHPTANAGVGRMSFTSGGLLPNTTYKYRVAAWPGSWSSAPVREATTLPSAPTEVSIGTVADTWISLRFAWPDAADRVIAYGPDSGVTYAVGARVPWSFKGTAYATGLQPATRYCFGVASEGAGGRSAAEPLCATTSGPPTMVTVPRLDGLLSSQASEAIQATHLKLGVVLNPTGEYRSDRLRVISQSQSVAPGERVREGTQIDYAVELAEKEHGLASITLSNHHVQARAVEVFVWDSVGRQWSEGDSLGYGESTTLSLTSGRVYSVVAVDRGLLNCTDGRPDNLSCQRFQFGALGDSDGTPLDLSVK